MRWWMWILLIVLVVFLWNPVIWPLIKLTIGLGALAIGVIVIVLFFIILKGVMSKNSSGPPPTPKA
ncbi:hypothetical protein HY967_03640 [Candidatus Jorgensenbacteria bacterium]|nr:hypothetical protein [Candidatus Jorgensenbacteria bacterium]